VDCLFKTSENQEMAEPEQCNWFSSFPSICWLQSVQKSHETKETTAFYHHSNSWCGCL